ncbi:hypothetical protein [uncultured Pseudokineococcus sp.]|uniref:hypothetical protein n=1 Tax=uncultured Pseudokineococcus sp. TaxID=1642928 RepID=UPI0026026273|nr:hypothetical protein [uncultured Pseudokineococcus sp.]
MDALPRRVAGAGEICGDMTTGAVRVVVLEAAPVMATPAIAAGVGVVGSAAVGYFAEEAGDS